MSIASLQDTATGTSLARATSPLPVVSAKFAETINIDGLRADGDVTGRVISAKLIRDYQSATSLEIVLNDQDFKILRSGLISKQGRVRHEELDQAAWARFGASRLTIDGFDYLLAGVSTQYDADVRQVTLTFEDAAASYMRRHKGPFHWTRRFSTRAHFIYALTRKVRERWFPFNSPSLDARQPIKGTSQKAVAKARRKGFAPGKKLTIKGRPWTAAQKRNVEIALREADAQQAGDLATLAMLCAGIGESSFVAQMNLGGSPYGGVFQGNVRGGVFKLNDTAGMAHSFLVGGKGFQGGGAIKLAADHPNWEPGQIALTVEGSLANFGGNLTIGINFYNVWKKEAQAILDAWGGVGEIKLVRHHYTFRVGRHENYWDASVRLAQEVRWRFFADENEYWFAPDVWFFQRQPTFLVNGPDDPAIRSFTGTADVGIPVGELTIETSIPRWVGPPGSVVELEDFGPYTGRWLLAHSELDLFTEDATVVLHRPAPKLPEPAGTVEKVVQSESTPGKGSPRARIVAVAKRAMKDHSHYDYRQLRPMHSSLFGHSSWPIYVDCSEFVTLVYKAAGCPDPNGAGYDGSGYTGTLAANGTKTNDPQPGDLCLYGPGPGYSHVTIYIGDGQQIGIGSPLPLGIHQAAAKYRSDFAGYWTFDLGS